MVGETHTADGKRFSHARHLEVAGLDCAACHEAAPHGTAAHGRPSFPRSECASCHHTESDDGGADFDPWDCAACHGHQIDYLVGEVAGFDEVPGAMADKDCESYHGEPPDVAAPSVQLCALCHDDEYPAMPAAWRARTEELTGRLRAALTSASPGAAPLAVDRARRALEAVEADGSHGAHNIDWTEEVLTTALDALE